MTHDSSATPDVRRLVPTAGPLHASAVLLVLSTCWTLAACGNGSGAAQAASQQATANDKAIVGHAERLIEEGREAFRSNTFGDEAFWGDALRLHEAIAGAAHGGVGDGLSPRNALALGLKVDVHALPSNVRNQIARGDVDLDDPTVTLLLLQLGAVIGVTGHDRPAMQRRSRSAIAMPSDAPARGSSTTNSSPP